jgi:hypothetical protein
MLRLGEVATEVARTLDRYHRPWRALAARGFAGFEPVLKLADHHIAGPPMPGVS